MKPATMLFGVFRYELTLQARRFFPWLSFAVMTGLIYQVATEAQFEQARDGGYFFNAPIVIATVTLFGSLMALLVSAPLAGDAAARDVQLRMHPLVYTTPVGKGAYLGGRFLAAFAVQALILLAVPLGLLLATLSPGLEPELLGPFRPGAYLGAYLLLALPNAFIAAALGFTLAALSRRPMASYLGSVLVFIAMMVGFAYVAHKLGHWGLGKLLDPLGFTLMRELSQSWTAAEKNARLIGLQGALLANRLLWMGLSLGLLALTHLRFRFAHPHTEARRWGRRPQRADATQAATARTAPIAVPRVRRSFGPAARVRQVGAVAWGATRALVTGGGAIPLLGMPVLLLLIAPEVMSHNGVPFVPTTEQLAGFIGASGDLFGLLIPLFAVWCAGELVWREREAGLGEIADATPVPDWVPFLGKLGALVGVLVALHVLMLAAALFVQVNAGYTHFEPGLYLRMLFGLQLAERLVFALLALTVHVLVDQKYVGHFVVVLTYGLRTFARSLGLEHHLLVYGANPGWSYSDLRGFGPSLVPWAWFTLYWAAWALLLAVAARLLWVRGPAGGLRARLQGARRRLTRPVAATAALAAALILGLGAFILYNTNVLNTFRTAAEVQAQRAEYERRYAQYADVEQPQLIGTRLHLELYPQRREALLQGTYQLVNRSPAPIDTVHLAPAPDVETRDVRFDRPATVRLSDETLGHRIYVLAQPLQPGDSLQLHFEVRYAPRGFGNDGADEAVTANDTYFVHGKLLPALGYQARRELSDAGERRQHGLPPRPAVRALEDSDEVRDGSGPRIAFEAVVGTDEGQVAIAPGALRRTWTEGGRRYFQYVTDAPIRNDYAFYSAAYAVHEGRWNDVAIQVFHHPDHGRNAPRMVKSVEASLSHLSALYGPYRHRQLRLVEHPGAGVGLHASAVNISFREGFSFLDVERDPHDIDFPFAVVAHEVSHQWFCGQVTPAWKEGAPVLCESIAWYSAMSVVEKTYGPEHLGRLMDLMREAYLTPRSRADVPLLRATDWFLAYRKGPFAMFALREYVGEARVNAALRRMVERYGAGTPPLPTSLDLYRELQAVTPEPQHGLLHDLFEANTFWALQTRRAAVEPAGEGTWWVTLDVQARKEVVDPEGRATEVPMDDLVEVGVYAAAADGAQGEPLYLARHRLRSGAQQLRVRVKGEPARAGIDPRHLLIDVKPEDNFQEAVPSPSGRGTG